MTMQSRFHDDLVVEIFRVNIGESEFEKRLVAVIRALLEIDEALQKRESTVAVNPVVAAEPQEAA